MKARTKSVITLGVLGLVVAVPALAGTTLQNPIGTTDPNVLIANVIKVFLGAVGMIALAMFIYGGLMMLISGGSSERVKKGRDILMWATIGLVIIFGSYGLVDAVFDALAGQSLV